MEVTNKTALATSFFLAKKSDKLSKNSYICKNICLSG